MSPAEGRIRKKDGVRGVWIIPSNDERKVADLGDCGLDTSPQVSGNPVQFELSIFSIKTNGKGHRISAGSPERKIPEFPHCYALLFAFPAAVLTTILGKGFTFH